MSNLALGVSPFVAVLGDERHEIYEWFARQGTVHRIETAKGADWLVTGYAEARQLLTDPRLIKGGWEHGLWARKLPEGVARGLYMHMLNSDPPAHTRLRRLLLPSFARRKVDLLAPRVRQIADRLLTAADRGGTVDLLTMYAYPLPINVICELIGVPEEDRADFRAWTAPIMSPAFHSFEEYAEAATALLGYSRRLIEKRRGNLGDDLLSDLLAAQDDGDALAEDELTSMIFLLIIAGHETTVNLIGNGVRALLSHPDQLGLIRHRPELLDSAIEELLRYDGPMQNTPTYRTAAPIEIGGKVIPADSRVYVTLMAANRDPRRFPDGHRLDVTRGEAGHLAFGHGIHYCVGAPLARLEGRVALGTLFDRFPDVHLAVPADEVIRTPSLVMNSLTALPVRLRRDEA